MEHELIPVKIDDLSELPQINDDDLLVLQHKGTAYKLSAKKFLEYAIEKYRFSIEDGHLISEIK